MLLFVAIAMVLATSFFCSLSEAALLSVSRVRLETLSKHNRAAAVVLKLKEKVDHPIASILFLNTVANTGGAALAGREYQRMFGGSGMLGFTIGLTIAVLIFSELLPKSLGVQHATRVVLLLARPLQLLVALMRPMVWLIEAMNRLIGRQSTSPTLSLEDLQAVLRLAFHSQTLDREERMIIEAAARLPKVTVQQIMIHRRDMVYLSLAKDEHELLVTARRSMHSRVPLCHNDLNDLIGITSIKEVLWRMVAEPEDLEEHGVKRILGEAVREPLFVSEELEVAQLLKQFSQAHEHVAVVRSEVEGAGPEVVGMVTLEDVIEELIGEVDDEYDRSPRVLDHLGEQGWRIGGGTRWKDAAAALHLAEVEGYEDPDLDGRFDLHDLAQDRLPGKLRTGAVFSIGPWRFQISRMRRGKVLYLEAVRMGQDITPPPRPSSTKND